MENTITLYKKNFSKIGTLQSSKQISYGMIETQENGISQYGIGIYVDENGSCEHDFLTGISSSKEETLEIVTFLYENSVQIANWREITCDLLIHCMAEY